MSRGGARAPGRSDWQAAGPASALGRREGRQVGGRVGVYSVRVQTQRLAHVPPRTSVAWEFGKRGRVRGRGWRVVGEVRAHVQESPHPRRLRAVRAPRSGAERVTTNGR